MLHSSAPRCAKSSLHTELDLPGLDVVRCHTSPDCLDEVTPITTDVIHQRIKMDSPVRVEQRHLAVRWLLTLFSWGVTMSSLFSSDTMQQVL